MTSVDVGQATRRGDAARGASGDPTRVPQRDDESDGRGDPTRPGTSHD